MAHLIIFFKNSEINQSHSFELIQISGFNLMLRVSTSFIPFLGFITAIICQISLPFSVQSELRVKFLSTVTDSKLNIYQNLLSSLNCAPQLTVTFNPKQNSYISYFIMEWSKDGSNILYQKIDVQSYLYTNQQFSFTQKIATYNCQQGGKSDYSYQPGKYSFVFTLWDNNKRTEIIGKVTVSQELECTLMNTGCWANKACYYNSNCKPKSFLGVEQEEIADVQ